MLVVSVHLPKLPRLSTHAWEAHHTSLVHIIDPSLLQHSCIVQKNAGAFVAIKMVTAENLNTGALSSWSQIGRVVMQCKVLLEEFCSIHCSV